MNAKTKFLIAALATVVAMPASAQRLGTEKPRDSKPQLDETTATSATSTSGRKLSISPGAQKAIIELQTAVNNKDVANIPAKLAAARAVAKTPDDKFAVASNQTRAALAANDNAAIQTGIEAMQASGSSETVDIAARYSDLGRRFKAAGQIDLAVAALNKGLAINPNSVPALINLAAIKDSQGQKAEAVSLMQKSFLASKASGAKVEEGNYKFAAGLAYAQRMPLANDIARQWVAAYPSPASWRDSLRIYRDLNRPTQAQLIDLLRLGRAANALSGEADYFALGSALVAAGRLGEAKSLMVEARTAPKVDTTKSAFTDVVKKSAAAPARAAIDASAKAALAGANGKAMIDAGDGLYGVGAYAEAVPLYRAALTKGGDSSLANLHLGMALARSGDKAGATAALNAVTGANAEVARYWLLWLATTA